MATCLICNKADGLARGLCQNCYRGAKRDGVLNKYPTKVRSYSDDSMCEECHESRPISLGLCMNCYSRYRTRLKPKPSICEGCGIKIKNPIDGLCKRCVKSKKAQAKGCSLCDRDGAVVAGGMCRACYYRERSRNTPLETCPKCYKKRKLITGGLCTYCYRGTLARECPECGKVKRPSSGGMCSACYRRTTGIGVIHTQSRMAKMSGLDSTLTREEWEVLLKMTDNRCLYCGEQSDSLQHEHWIPVDRDGPYTYSNIVPACGQCNMSKGTMTGEEYLEKIGVTLVCDIQEIKQIAKEVYGDGM